VIGSGSTASTINPKTLTKATVITTPIVSSVARAYTTLVVYTTNGEVRTSTSVGSTTVASTIGEATSTIQPSLQNGGSGGGSSGLSTSSKNVIAGVVGGIGGAILIGGIALVAWRLWGKKSHTKLPQDEDIFSSPATGVVHESKTPSSMGSRFSDPADRYQSVNRPPVNTASNF